MFCPPVRKIIHSLKLVDGNTNAEVTNGARGLNFSLILDEHISISFATLSNIQYSKTCVKWPLSKRPKIGYQYQLSLNAGQKYCRMLQGEHSAILSSFIRQLFVIKIFVLSIFEWPFTQVLL